MDPLIVTGWGLIGAFVFLGVMVHREINRLDKILLLKKADQKIPDDKAKTTTHTTQ